MKTLTKNAKSKKIKNSSRIKKVKMNKVIVEAREKKPKFKKFKAMISGERIISKDKEAMNLYGKSTIGEPIEGKVYYSLVEASYLLDQGKINIYEKNKKLTKEKFFDIAKKTEPNFWTRYRVFKDLRSRGYIVKTALKFGADFRVYNRGIRPGQDHARWIVFPVYETSSLTWHEFAAKNRVAHSTKKQLLMAVVDEEGDVSYWEVRWIRP
jgi:tRNA-intron endonuclease